MVWLSGVAGLMVRFRFVASKFFGRCPTRRCLLSLIGAPTGSVRLWLAFYRESVVRPTTPQQELVVQNVSLLHLGPRCPAIDPSAQTSPS